MISKLKNLTSGDGFKKYFANTSWLFFEKTLRLILGLFIGIWVARYLGPEQFGFLSYVQSFVALFAVIATLGLDGIVVRELVKDESRRDEIIGSAFYLKLIGAIVVLTMLAIAVTLTSKDAYTISLVFIVASVSVFQSFNVVDYYFQSKVLSKYVVYANIISLLASSIIKIFLILNEAPLIAFAWTILFDSVVLAFSFIYFYIKNNFSIRKWRLKLDVAKSLLKDSWPLVLSGIVISVYMKIDQVMIKEMLDSKAVGHYAAAVRLSESWYFIPAIIASSLFPAIVKAKNQSEELYLIRLQNLFDLMVWLAIAIAIPMTFMSDFVINLLYGEEYGDAGSVLTVHIWAGIAVSFGIVWSRWILVENKQRMIIVFHLLSMILNVVYNLYFIPKQGILGAGIATAFASLTAQLVGLFFYKRDIALKFLLKALVPIHYLKGK